MKKNILEKMEAKKIKQETVKARKIAEIKKSGIFRSLELSSNSDELVATEQGIFLFGRNRAWFEPVFIGIKIAYWRKYATGRKGCIQRKGFCISSADAVQSLRECR